MLGPSTTTNTYFNGTLFTLNLFGSFLLGNWFDSWPRLVRYFKQVSVPT